MLENSSIAEFGVKLEGSVDAAGSGSGAGAGSGECVWFCYAVSYYDDKNLSSILSSR